MTLLKSLCIAFSIYSKIPVPVFGWKDREMRYHMIFFPWVGAVIGLLLVLWAYLRAIFGIGDIAFVLIGTAIPLIVTGGFHVDGFMDTMDAFKSYKSKEEKLKILEDPHIGAFAVIMLAMLGLIYAAAFSQIEGSAIMVFAGSFFFARALSGIAVFSFPKAKKRGMLYDEYSSASQKRERDIVLKLLYVQAAVCAIYMLVMNVGCGIFVIAAALLSFVYYKHKSMREFGGITGDTAGYFVTISEAAMCAAAAIYCV